MSIIVDYIDHLGSDLTVVNSARVSFDKTSELEDGVLSLKDEKLINYLAKHNHFTPFTHPQITLRETVPIFVARQRFKHMIGFTYNEVSRRYVDSEPEFFYPENWRSRPDKSLKQGSGGTLKTSGVIMHEYENFINDCEDMYSYLLENGVAPEQARMVLPQSMLTSYYVTGSLAAFARLVNLRKDPGSQKEIQVLAEKIDLIISGLYPCSWNALTNSEN